MQRLFLSYGSLAPTPKGSSPYGVEPDKKTQVVGGYGPAEILVASGALTKFDRGKWRPSQSLRTEESNHCRTEAGRLRRVKKTAWSGSSSIVFLPSSWRWVVSLEVPMGLSLFFQSFCWPLFFVLLNVSNGLVLDGFGP